MWGGRGWSVNWVRFVKCGVAREVGDAELGSFRIIGGAGVAVEVNWVRFDKMRGGTLDKLDTGGTLWVPELGSFCIFGENPEVRIQNSGDGGSPLAYVLSDGGVVDTAFNSPCFWCCNPHYPSTSSGRRKAGSGG